MVAAIGVTSETVATPFRTLAQVHLSTTEPPGDSPDAAWLLVTPELVTPELVAKPSRASLPERLAGVEPSCETASSMVAERGRCLERQERAGPGPLRLVAERVMRVPEHLCSAWPRRPAIYARNRIRRLRRPVSP